MAEAVRDFVWSRPYLQPYHSAPTLLIGAASAGPGGLPACLPLLAIGPYVHLPQVHILEWQDDPYSLDLSAQFRATLFDPRNQPTQVTTFGVPYSVGGFGWLTRVQAYSPDQRELLVLPSVDRPARRILRGLTAALPLETRNLVAVTGDSISFNTIYRDRNFAWNIQDMPVTLVLFCHQNPVQWEQLPDDAELADGHASGTDDLLLNADIVRLVLEGAFQSSQLLSSSADLARRLRSRQLAFFQPDGNRLGGSGEHIVCLRPRIQDDRILANARIEVWTRKGQEWQPVREFRVNYAPK
ncbi:MAG: hypothetical protein L0Y72_24045, partial [Gemmataceae bacterium]|nr:hypothetical protein [Gemmataceae bacterium]